MNMVKGQLVVITYRSSQKRNADWEYGVVKDVYDNNVHILQQYGGNFMHTTDKDESLTLLVNNQPVKTHITPLTKNGKPVICAKNILGNYTFKPKKS